jgi:hypothetical protein
LISLSNLILWEAMSKRKTQTIGTFITNGIMALVARKEDKRPKYSYEDLLSWEKGSSRWYVDVLGAACLEEFLSHNMRLPKHRAELEEFYERVVAPHLSPTFVKRLRKLCEENAHPGYVLIQLCADDDLYAELERNVFDELAEKEIKLQ